VIAPGIWILSLRFWMYRVSEGHSSGAGAVPGSVRGVATGCCSGCGGAADMMEAVVAKRRYNSGITADHRKSHDTHMSPS